MVILEGLNIRTSLMVSTSFGKFIKIFVAKINILYSKLNTQPVFMDLIEKFSNHILVL